MKLLAFLLYGSLQAVRYKDCGTTGMKINDIKVTPCPVEPCELHHGQDYSIDISFDEQVEDELSLEICGYIGPLCVPFPTDTPKQIVKPGTNTFSLTMPIEPAYPNIKVVGKFTLSGTTSNKMCFMLPLKIMPAQKKTEKISMPEPEIETEFDSEPNQHQEIDDEERKLRFKPRSGSYPTL